MNHPPPYPSGSGSDNMEPIRPSSVAVGKSDALTELNASRSRLRNALMVIAHPPKQPALFSKGISGLGEQLLQRASALPMASAVIDGVRTWWLKSAARKALDLAPTSAPLVVSVARKNPQALLLTSVALGALLVLAPWRRLAFRLLRPALVSGIVFEVLKASTRQRGNEAPSPLNPKETP